LCSKILKREARSKKGKNIKILGRFNGAYTSSIASFYVEMQASKEL
jgi:hypothetical protein